LFTLSPPANVEVAVVEVPVKASATTPPFPTTERAAYGEEVEIPTLPFVELSMSFERDVVAKLVGLAESMYKFPPAFRKVQWFEESEPSERASCGPVDEAI
jgi:hypothetical protein